MRRKTPKRLISGVFMILPIFDYVGVESHAHQANDVNY